MARLGPVTVAPAATVRGGQFVAQAPEQVLVSGVSLFRTYSVMPFWPVRYAPRIGLLVDPRVMLVAPTGPAEVGIEVAPRTAAAGVAAADEQALAMTATPTARPASDVQRELGRILVSPGLLGFWSRCIVGTGRHPLLVFGRAKGPVPRTRGATGIRGAARGRDFRTASVR